MPIFDSLLKLYAIPFKRRKSLPKDIKKILIIRLDHIGDLALSLPAIYAIRRLYPEAEISLLVAPWSAELASMITGIDNIIVSPAPWFDRAKNPIPWHRLIKLMRRLRAERYDLGIDFRGYLYNILLMALGGVKYKLGYGVTGGGPLLEQELDYKLGIHESEYSTEIARRLGYRGDTQFPTLKIPESPKLLDQFNLHQGFVALNPFAGRPVKEWALQNWRRLGELVSKKFSIKPVVFGPLGRIKDSQTVDFAGGLNLIGRLSFCQWVYLLSKAEVVVSADSAAAHISSALNKPAVVIASGIEDMKRWRPLGKKVKVLWSSQLNCVPCGRKQGCEDMKCLKLITPEMVIEAMGEFIPGRSTW